MNSGIQKHVQVDPDTGEVLPVEADFASMAEELVAAARGQGIELTGPDGLLTGLTRQVLQTALEVEVAEHLGYDKHDPVGRNSSNSRNGSTPKTVQTGVGEVTVQVPRDRAGTFAPAVIPMCSSGALDWTSDLESDSGIPGTYDLDTFIHRSSLQAYLNHECN